MRTAPGCLVGRKARALGASVLVVALASSFVVAGAGVANATPDEGDPIAVTQDVIRPIPVEPSGRLARKKVADSKFAETAARALSVARSLKGSRYQLGGTTPEGFDCSGYVGYVLDKVGISNLPRDSHSMFKAVPAVSRKDAAPGDLVFFHGKSGFVSHVGIYAGGNDMWHAPQSGGSVHFAPIYSSNVTFGRVIKSE
jgi:cell wall-associated NlpC family hydrolase